MRLILAARSAALKHIWPTKYLYSNKCRRPVSYRVKHTQSLKAFNLHNKNKPLTFIQKCSK